MPTALQSREDIAHSLWQFGVFVVGGFPPDYEILGGLRYHEKLNFYSAGLEAGRMLTALHGSGVLHGRGEAVVEDTSRINFKPQVDFGENISSRKKQNLKLAVKVVHISSAGLGEYNPGVNVTVQFSLGYSWWK
jgi:hypothetical protein